MKVPIWDLELQGVEVPQLVWPKLTLLFNVLETSQFPRIILIILNYKTLCFYQSLN